MDVLTLVAKLTLDSNAYEKGLDAANKATYRTGQAIGTSLRTYTNGITSVAKGITKIPSAISDVGKKISSAGSAISSVGSSIESKITKPALAAATAVSGIFLAKGWARLTQIDEAKAKLRGLGNDAESVASIMDSALQSVKGTAFGMDEAATTAASAVAAGIQQGEDLTKYLTSVGDTAAIAGASMGDMGAIFNKVVTAGKAQNDVLGQLADRGIPIYQWLAEETGHASDEISKMAKDGEIDLATFRSAIEKHVGGAAKELGNATLTGAIKNVWAAVSRVGANFLGAADDANSFAGKVLPLIIKLQGAFEGLESKAKEWGAVFGEVFGLVIDYFEKGSADASQMSDTAQKIWGVISPILDKLTAAVEFLKGLSPEMVSALAAIALGAGPVIKYGGEAVKLIGLLMQHGGGLIGVISLIVGALGYFTATGQDTTGVMQLILDGITNLGEKIPEVASMITEGLSQVWDMIPEILDSAIEVGAQLITTLASGIAENMPYIMDAAGDIITSLLTSLTENAPSLIESGSSIFESIIEGITENLPRIVTTGAELISQVVLGIAENLPSLLSSATEMIGTLVQYLVENAPMLVSAAAELILSLAQGFAENFPAIVGMGLDLVVALAGALIENLPTLIAAVVELCVGIGEAFIEGVSKLPEYIEEALGWVGEKITAFKDMAVEWLSMTEAGQAFLNFCEGIKEFISGAIEFIQNVVGSWISKHQAEIDAFLTTLKFLITGTIENIKLIIGIAFDVVKNLVIGTINTVAGLFTAFGKLLKGDFKGAAEALTGIVKTHITTALNLFNDLKDRLSTWSSNMKDKFLSWGRDMLSNFIQGIKDKISGVVDAVKGVADTVKSYLHFSEPDVGPLKDFHTYAPDMMKLFAEGIEDNTKLITDQIGKSFDFSDAIKGPTLDADGRGSVGGAGVFSPVINLYANNNEDNKELVDMVMNEILRLYNKEKAAFA